MFVYEYRQLNQLADDKKMLCTMVQNTFNLACETIDKFVKKNVDMFQKRDVLITIVDLGRF